MKCCLSLLLLLAAGDALALGRFSPTEGGAIAPSVANACRILPYPSEYPLGAVWGPVCNQCLTSTNLIVNWGAQLQAQACANQGQGVTCVTQPTCTADDPCASSGLSWMVCSGPATAGQIRPKYFPTHVVYAPPGKSSTMGYSVGTTVGSSVIATSEQKTAVQFTAGVGVNVVGVASGSVSFNAGNTWDDTNQNEQDVALTLTSGYQIHGQADELDHDYDEVWFLANPYFATSIVPPQGWPLSGEASVTWSLGADEGTTQYFLYVGELNGHFDIKPGVQDALDSFGITPADFPQLLAADPLVSMPPGVIPDPTRFVFLQQMTYENIPLDGGQSSTTPYSVSRTNTSTQTVTANQAFTVGASVQGSVGFLGICQATFGETSQFTWTNTATNKNSTAAASTDSLSLGQPSADYGGPTILYVYEDTLWHTYAFQLSFAPLY